MYHTTGLSRDEIVELCALVHAAEIELVDKKWPPSLGLFDSVVVTLTYMRRNRVQEELAETYGTSQPTISRAISVITALIKKVLEPYVPTAEDLDERCQYLVDGTLLPCWSWAARPELYSGKHKTTGMNVQVACTLAEKLARISDPIEGSRPRQPLPGRIRSPCNFGRRGLDGGQRVRRQRDDHTDQETTEA